MTDYFTNGVLDFDKVFNEFDRLRAERKKQIEQETRDEKVVQALKRIKTLTDPDLEPFDQDRTRQLLAMRHRSSDAWVIAAEALDLFREDL